MVMGFAGAVVYSARSVDILFWNAQRKSGLQSKRKQCSRHLRSRCHPCRSELAGLACSFAGRWSDCATDIASLARRAALDWCLARHLLSDTDQLAIEGE